MCTLTWWRGAAGEGYEVFFNRDELKTRPPAKPPAAGERGGVRFLSPVDTQAGGTWIWANQFGVVMALLNWYDRESGGILGSGRPVAACCCGTWRARAGWPRRALPCARGGISER